MEVLDVKWANGTIGIVKAKNGAGDVYIYVGTIIGHHEEDDIQYVLDWGSKFTQDEFQKFVK